MIYSSLWLMSGFIFLLLMMVISEPVQGVSRKGKVIRIITFGDSITHGIRPDVSEKETYTYFLESLLNGNGFHVVIMRSGLSGETTEGALQRIDRDVIAGKPDYVTIMYGTNDAAIDIWKDPNDTTPRLPLSAYEANLRKIINKLRAHGITPVLMTPIPMCSGRFFEVGIYQKKGLNFKLEEYVVMVRRIAFEEKVILVDHYQRWLNWKKMGKNIDAWLPDGVHPNVEGNRFIAATIFKTLKKHLIN